MIDEIDDLQREWLEADREVKRLRLALVDAWRSADPDVPRQMQAEQKAASSRLKAINIRLREIVETAELALTASQVSKACDLLGWTIPTLAYQTNISAPTLERATKDGTAHMQTIKMVTLRGTLEKAGIEFTRGKKPGARQRNAGP